MSKKRVCMIVQDRMVKGGIAAVINSYYGSKIEDQYDVTYVESYKDGGKLTKLMKGIAGYFVFLKVLITNRPDLVHIHSSFGPSFMRKLPFIYMAAMFNIPIINHIHGADFDQFYVNAIYKKKKLIENVYGKCDKLIALSDEWRMRLSKIVSSDKIEVIENYSVVNNQIIESRKNRNVNDTVLFLGEIGKRKGCYDIPDVVEIVSRSIPNVRFVIAGSGSEIDVKSIKDSLQQKKIFKNVEFPGWIRNEVKEKYLQEADVFFLPSYNEGMPMSILDAMGCSLPIVSTNVGGIPKIVKNNINGFCCEAGDVKAFSDAIILLLSDSDLNKKMSAGSLEIVMQKYSFEYHMKRLIELYERTFR